MSTAEEPATKASGGPELREVGGHFAVDLQEFGRTIDAMLSEVGKVCWYSPPVAVLLGGPSGSSIVVCARAGTPVIDTKFEFGDPLVPSRSPNAGTTIAPSGGNSGLSTSWVYSAQPPTKDSCAEA